MQKFKLVTLSLLGLLLVGCEDKTTFSYLISHPAQLSDATKYCQTLLEQTEQQKIYCYTVDKASKQFAELLRSQQIDPEAFGQRIMKAQAEVVKLKAAYLQACQQAETQKKQNAKPAEVLKAERYRDQLKSALNDQEAELGGMTAVIGLNSPE